MQTSQPNGPTTKTTTVYFLLYNAEKTIQRLFDVIHQQLAGRDHDQHSLEFVFVDDGSRDRTVQIIEKWLIQNTAYYVRLEKNPTNMGLAASANRALMSCKTDFAITNHCDCFPVSNGYYEKMTALIQANQTIAAITGKPVAPVKNLTIVDQVTLVSNLMDVIPNTAGETEVVPVSFAEGRCDVFRISALRSIGFYDQSLRTSGEDQLLARALMGQGYTIAQALGLKYEIGLSSEQDSIIKLVKHVFLFGRTQAHILASGGASATFQAVSGSSQNMGGNRALRRSFRLSQLINFCIFFLIPFIGVKGLIIFLWVTTAKLWLAREYFENKIIRANGVVPLILIQPFLDVSYGFGFLVGVVRYLVWKKN